MPVSVDKLSASLYSNLLHKASTFNWPAGSFIVITPFVALYGLFATSFSLHRLIVHFIFYIMGMLSVTVGYHRHWSHRAFDMHRVPQILCALFGPTVFSMSIYEWVKDHRTHHKYTDTAKDPYDSTRGLWYSHVGWLLEARELPCPDIRDLEADPLIRWQHKYYIPLAFILGWGLPAAIIVGMGWGDWRDAFYSNIIRTVIVHHIIFSINSFAHWTGNHVFAERSPRDNHFLALLTFGEGYHNYHHEFPYDYRNGIKWLTWDPSKWSIFLMECVGLAWNLNRTDDAVIEKARVQTLLNIMQRKKASLYWGKPIDSLPLYPLEQVKKDITEKNMLLVMMGNIVYDVTEFLPLHPGGDKILRPYIGKDISKEFNGGVYLHTNSAKYILDTLRVGVLERSKPCPTMA